MAYTISTTNDNRKKNGQQMQDFEHNLREESAVKSANSFDVAEGRKPHIDVERSHLNKYIKTESLEEAYERIFGGAVTEYNAKQKRKDRHTSVQQEMEKIKNSINNKNPQYLCYEMIGQIGNEKCHPDVELCNKILEEFLQEWERKYPNLIIFQAVIHNDEATPHMHIDYIPVAYNNKRGLSVQNGLRRAYEEMGFTNQEKEAINKETGETITVFDREGGAKAQWIKDCNNLLEEICKKYGLEIEHPMQGKNAQRMQMNEYKETMEENEKLKQENSNLKKEKRLIQREILKIENEKENLESENNFLYNENLKFDKEIDKKNFELNKAKNELENVENEINKMEEFGDRLHEDLEQEKENYELLKNKFQNLKNDIEKSSLQYQLSQEQSQELVDSLHNAFIRGIYAGRKIETEKMDKEEASNFINSTIQKQFKEIAPTLQLIQNNNNKLKNIINEKITSFKKLIERKKEEKVLNKELDQIHYADYFKLYFDMNGQISEKSEKYLERQIQNMMYENINNQNWKNLQKIFLDLDNENRGKMITYIKEDCIRNLRDYNSNEIQMKKEKFRGNLYRQSPNYFKFGQGLLQKLHQYNEMNLEGYER